MAEAFGHESVVVGGTPPNVAAVCARCRWTTYSIARPHRKVKWYVPWPCTSAVVLGLVSRRESTS